MNETQELKLPDHILVRKGDRVTVTERSSGERRAISTRGSMQVERSRPRVRFLAALASGVLAVYFSYMFIPRVFSSPVEMVLLPVLVSLPIILDFIFNGKVALVSYIIAFLAFAIYEGVASGQEVSLGMIFLISESAQGSEYLFVPASDMVTAMFMGLLPFLTLRMVGQAMARLRVHIPSSEGEYVMELSHGGLVKELESFLEENGVKVGS